MVAIIEDKLICDDGCVLAYRRLMPQLNNNAANLNPPGIVFLGGYMSDMMGNKASHLEAFCQEQGLAFIRFDYYAHGASPGDPQTGSIGLWKENALCILDKLTEGPQILVGSSMGGWIMLWMALARRERIKGLIGIAPATDFIDFMHLNAKQEEDLEKNGICYLEHQNKGKAIPLLKHFVEDAKKHRLLFQNSDSHKPVIDLACPVRILHGMEDKEVPWQHSLKLMEALAHDARLTLIKEGNHRLSRPEDLSLISNTIKDLINSHCL